MDNFSDTEAYPGETWDINTNSSGAVINFLGPSFSGMSYTNEYEQFKHRRNLSLQDSEAQQILKRLEDAVQAIFELHDRLTILESKIYNQ